MTRSRIAYILLNIASALILIIGLVASVLLYQAADRGPVDASMYEQDDGSTYPVSPYDSKKYLRSMELYGGKANVLAGELRFWFAGLWQGKSLAYMVAGLSVLVSFALFYAATRVACFPHPHEGGRNKGNNESDEQQLPDN